MQARKKASDAAALKRRDLHAKQKTKAVQTFAGRTPNKRASRVRVRASFILPINVVLVHILEHASKDESCIIQAMNLKELSEDEEEGPAPEKQSLPSSKPAQELPPMDGGCGPELGLPSLKVVLIVLATFKMDSQGLIILMQELRASCRSITELMRSYQR